MLNKELSSLSYLIEKETDIDPAINNDSLNGVITSGEIFKYLGVFLTPKLSLTENNEYSAKQAYKAIACIFKYQLSFGQFRHKEAFKLFESMVRPILCYAAELWGYQ